jgi:hypothetical protein
MKNRVLVASCLKEELALFLSLQGLPIVDVLQFFVRISKNEVYVTWSVTASTGQS